MKNWFTVTIQSSKLQDLSLHTEVYNLAEIPDIICVKLPDSLPRDMQLSSIYDLYSDENLDFDDKVSRDENRPWIDIQSALLDMSVGQHVYRLSFCRLGAKLNAICWFGYIIQDNHVEKPYIYMDRTLDSGDDSSDTETN